MNKMITALAFAAFSTTSMASSTVYTFDDIIPLNLGNNITAYAHVDIQEFDNVQEAYDAGLTIANGQFDAASYSGAGSEARVIESGQKIIMLTCKVTSDIRPSWPLLLGLPTVIETPVLSMEFENGADYELYAVPGVNTGGSWGQSVNCIPGIRKL